MLEYGGGGHDAAGTCQIPNDSAERMLKQLIEQFNATSSAEVPVLA